MIGYIRESLIGISCCLELDHRLAVHISGGEVHNEHDGHDDERSYSASTKRTDGPPPPAAVKA